MNLSVFTSTAKHIAASTFIALALFTLMASQSAHSSDGSATTNKVLSEQAYLVVAMEESHSQAKQVLRKAQQEFEKNEISTEEIFFVTLKFYEIENELLKAKNKLALLNENELCETRFTNVNNHDNSLAGR